MKLLKLLPEQVMTHWESIKNCVWNALPPLTYSSDETILNIQEKFLLGTLQCWAAIESVESPIIYGIVVTQIVVDEISQTKNMLLFAVSVINEHPHSMWSDAYESLRAVAKANDCKTLVAYSNQEKVFHIAQNLGADISWRFLQFPV